MTFSKHYGPWALIAGASEGTGSAFARRLAREGVSCVLVARREAPLAALAAELQRDYGVAADIVIADLASPGAAEYILRAIAEREVGLLVVNAGADENSATFLDEPLEQWISLAHRNVIAAMELCHIFARPMRARGRGGIILVGSGAGYGGGGHMAVYAGTKAFDLCFAEGLWAELKQHGVDVLSLMLGRTDTPAHRANLERRGLPVPAGLAQPDEVAREALERLPFGPVHNFGLSDAVGSPMQPSAASRRDRVEALAARAAQTFGTGQR